jgi:hypothetical protein
MSPIRQTLARRPRRPLLHSFHFIFTCKPASHTHLSSWVEALEPGRARRTFFQHLQAVTTYWHFETWAGLMDFMMQGLEIGPYAVQKS